MKIFAVSSLAVSGFAASIVAASIVATSSTLIVSAAAFDGGTPAAMKTDGAKVSGRITFDGKRPEPKPLSATPEQQKGCCPEGKSVNVTDPTFQVDENSAIHPSSALGPIVYTYHFRFILISDV